MLSRPTFSSPAARRIIAAGERFQRPLLESIPVAELEREAVVRQGVADASADIVEYPLPRTLGVGRAMINEACRLFDVTPAGIIGPGRNQRLVRARQWIAVRLYDEYGWSTPRIGLLLHKDHTTIMHAYRERARLDTWMRAKLSGEDG